MSTPLRYLIEYLQNKYEVKTSIPDQPQLSDDMFKITYINNDNAENITLNQEREAYWGPRTDWPPYLAEIELQDAIKLLVLRTPDFLDTRIIDKDRIIIYDFGQGNGILFTMKLQTDNELRAFSWGCRHKHLITRSINPNEITKTCSTCNKEIFRESIRKTL